MGWKIVFLLTVLTVVNGAPAAKNDFTCEVCHVVVNDFTKLIAENATQATVESKLEDICKRLTANVDTCLNFVGANAAGIFEQLVKDLEPETICILLEVCPKQEFFQKEKAPDATPLECEVCKLLIGELDTLLKENKTQVAVTNAVHKLCSSLTDSLKKICDAYAPKFIQVIVSGVDQSKACEEIKACTEEGGEIQSEDVVVDKTPDVEVVNTIKNEQDTSIVCEICKLIVTEIDWYMKKNDSSQSINATVEKVCNKLPSALKTVCNGLAPQIVKHVEAGFDPLSSCVYLKICEQGTKFPVRDPKVEANPLECEICKVIIKELDKKITTNASKEKITEIVNEFCDSLPASLKAFCDEHKENLIKAISQGLRADGTCKFIKLCTAAKLEDEYFPQVPIPESVQKQDMTSNLQDSDDYVRNDIEDSEVELKSLQCDLCTMIISLIDSELARNASYTAINNTIFQLCSLLPPEVKPTCDLIAPTLVQKIEQGFDPATACDEIKLCINGTNNGISPYLEAFAERFREEQKKSKHHKLKDVKCQLCEFLVTIVDQELGKNASLDKINSTVYSLCNLLPATVKAACDLIAPTVVKELAHGLDPMKTCETVKLCPNGTNSEEISIDLHRVAKEFKNRMQPKVVPAAIGDSVECEICEVIIQILDEYLESNASGHSINETVFKICDLLPSAVKDICFGFAPTVVKAVEDGVDPEKACTAVELCTNNTLRHVPEIPGLSCEMCHGIVETILPQQYSEQLGYSLCEVTCPQSNTRHRRSVKKVSHIVSDIITKEGGKLKLRVGEDIECDICTWVAEAANIFLKDNHTEEAIANNLNSICQFMPAPYDKVCSGTIPEIIKELEHGFEPKKACIEIMPDDCKNLTKVVGAMPKLLVQYINAIPVTESRCDLCENAIKILMEKIEKQDSQIRQYIEDVCSRFPSPTNTACNSFVGKEYPVIVEKIINKLIDPVKVCTMAKICPEH